MTPEKLEKIFVDIVKHTVQVEKDNEQITAHRIARRTLISTLERLGLTELERAGPLDQPKPFKDADLLDLCFALISQHCQTFQDTYAKEFRAGYLGTKG